MEVEKMLNLTKVMILAMVLFGSTSLFAEQPSDLQVINMNFQGIDTNQDQSITSNEMYAYQAQAFQKLDSDRNNELNSEELKADRDNMHASADKNQDGKITQDESNSQFNEYFKQMDTNQDGKISEAEYTDYWKLIHKF
jgi:Ca2+-binding EF-hand superfamily protein